MVIRSSSFTALLACLLTAVAPAAALEAARPDSGVQGPSAADASAPRSTAAIGEAPAGELQAIPEKPVVVELFLSQACSACPPAAEALRDIADRSDVLALSWHVDYWDVMAGGQAGRWHDPYAHQAFSARQRDYNERLSGRRKVFTPQAVVDGRQSVVGSRRDQLLERIDVATGTAPSASRLRFDAGTVSVSAGAYSYDILLVRYLRNARTEILAGANRGRVFDEANIVIEAGYLARGVVGDVSLEAPPPETREGVGCAILLQVAGMGPIQDVALCD
ncbi:MAG: DUF1223 domain-containing protein [Alphaproteobacteria bacterium]|nr:DUF1223 domain-containing protein [Alphaproteobacteria bacterium]